MYRKSSYNGCAECCGVLITLSEHKLLRIIQEVGTFECGGVESTHAQAQRQGGWPRVTTHQ